MKIILLILLIGALSCVVSNAADVFSFERLKNTNENDSDGLCPNKKTKCSSTGTCCKTKHNSYHCCRYENAVCCSDLYHCCPSGSTCDLENKKCNRNLAAIFANKQKNDPMEWKVENEDDKVIQSMTELSKSDNLLAPSSSSSLLSDITCPNNKTKCKDTKTCCITKHGNYYCCPHKNAICCEDKWLCCPEGSTCDVKNKKCLDSRTDTKIDTHNVVSELTPTNTIVSAVQHFLDLFLKVGKQCGSSHKSCPGEKKCCPMTGENFGCCKYRKGVCCQDLVTCCPHGTTCDLKNKVCSAVPENLVPVQDTVVESDTKCNDNITTCGISDTCCPVGNVLYGCCPFKDATCCSDKASCCPHNKKCDLKNRRCVNNDAPSAMKMLETKKFLIRKRESLVVFLSNIGLKRPCPDNSSCSEDGTCCPTYNGHYGCCPYSQATCCSDKTSCCPGGTQCTANGCS